MNRLLALAAITTGLVSGCGQAPSASRYQIARVDDGVIVRLDTHTGEMRRFVAVADGDVAAPSQVRIVYDHASLKGCDELYESRLPRVGAKDATAQLGGDTAFFGKTKGGDDGAWPYKCKKLAPSAIQ